MEQLPVALSKSVSGTPAEVKQAEGILSGLEQKPGFTTALLGAITAPQTPDGDRLAGTIYFKNFIGKYWPLGDEQDWVIPQPDCQLVKGKIVEMLITAPPNLQKLFIDALEVISTSEFPQKWPTILPELVGFTKQALQAGDIKQTINLLKATSAVLHRFKNSENTEDINRELFQVLHVILGPLEDETRAASALLKAAQTSKDKALVFEILYQIIKIFYLLIIVELPEKIEDKLEFWIGEQLGYLEISSTEEELIGDEDADEPGILLKLHAAIFTNLSIFVQKYEEEIQPFLQRIIFVTWNVLVRAKPSNIYSPSVSAGLHVITCMSKGPCHTYLAADGVLAQVCENIIVPNVVFQNSDKERFKDDPVDYIRYDLEDAEHVSRRNGVIELIQGLRKHFEQQITDMLASYSAKLLNDYKTDPKANWKQKDAAVCLLSALTICGAVTSRGVREINSRIPFQAILQEHILPELGQYPNNQPVIQADILKFISTFRNQIPGEHYGAIIGQCVRMLESKYYVVNSYASICIDSLLSVKDGDIPRFKPDQQSLSALLNATFTLLGRSESQDNEYIMKTIAGVLAASAEIITPDIVAAIMGKLKDVLDRICKQPKSADFNHFVFEAIACLINCLHKTSPGILGDFEKSVLPLFQAILKDDFAGFAPYVYQLMSMFLFLTPASTLSELDIFVLEHYAVVPDSWEATGNVPALVRLLKAFLRKDAQTIIQRGKFDAILGVFQKLLASANQDHFAFDLMRVIIQVTPPDHFSAVSKAVFTLCFQRLANKKTPKVIRGFVGMLCNYILKYSVFDAAKQCDPYFGRVKELWLEVLGVVVRPAERRAIALGTTKAVCDEAMLTPENFQTWANLIVALGGFLTSVNKIVGDEGDQSEDLFHRQQGTHTSFVPLINAFKIPEPDPFENLAKGTTLESFAISSLKQFCASHQKEFAELRTILSNDEKAKTQEFVQELFR